MIVPETALGAKDLWLGLLSEPTYEQRADGSCTISDNESLQSSPKNSIVVPSPRAIQLHTVRYGEIAMKQDSHASSPMSSESSRRDVLKWGGKVVAASALAGMSMPAAHAAEDHTIRQQEGVAGVRRCRLMRMAEEAFQQGGVLTLEDLAALLNCGVRTLSRDLQQLRREGLVPPLRSLIQDMGRALTHRREIVSLWLQGLEYSEIAHRSRHAVDSVANYVEKFKRCGSLFVQAFDLHTVAFLVGISPALAAEYHHLWSEATPVAHRRRELEQWSQKNDLPSAATLREP